MFRLGLRMAIRLPSTGAYAAQVEKEQRWLPQLAPDLPVPIPTPLRRGQPTPEYPFPWSIYGWLNGEALIDAAHVEPMMLAEELGSFLRHLRRLDTTGGPVAGAHNFHRGGPLRVYDGQTRQAITTLDHLIDGSIATRVWSHAVSTQWEQAPVWVHGDVSAGNLLVEDGRLSAVIDFGCLGIGDPACDLVMAWTFFDAPCRERFRLAVGLDAATWQRARGWALWKALITFVECRYDDQNKAARQSAIIATLLACD